ncbi:MAG TPA: hypothetical protein VK483_04455 [Chitinophagaceae bacterium]|nr:hypothetical protein [Chitinophagaceae bacterium]
MKRLFFGVILFSILVFVSCQKEIDWGFDSGNPATKLLVRIKSKTGTDTTQLDYTYDAGKKIIREKTTGISGGTSLDNDLVIKRNASGIITTTVQKSAALLAAGIDSIETRYNYNTGTSKYTSSVFQISIPGFDVTDSAVYNYDGSGRITGDDHYLQINGLPIPLPPVLSLKNYYIYTASGSNIDSVKQDAATTPGGPLSPVSSQAYHYDSKINPLIISNEAILLTRTGLYNANNPTKAVVTNTVDPTQDFTMDYTYRYNNVNKPDSSYGTRTPGGTVTAAKYFYQ